MKIGLDAKWFFEGPPSGRVVIRNLVKHLVEILADDELYIFLDSRERNTPFPYAAPNIHLVYIWAGNNMLSNVFVFPFVASPHKLDIVVFQNFTPLVSNFKRYAYIHDVLFYTHPEFYTMKERLYLSPLKVLVQLAHRLCTVSTTEKSRMIQTGYATEDNIDVIYHGVDEQFKPREGHDPGELQSVSAKYSLPENFILYVGRLNVRKNVANLFRAIPLLHDGASKLVVVGAHDWKTNDLDELIDTLNVKDRVVFTGPVYGDELSRIYSLARVFCFISFAESFGLPALEGMASGVPVVVSDRTCLPEICQESALYADPDDPNSIAKQIDALLHDEVLWYKMRDLGLRRASEFTWRKSAEGLLKSVHRTVADGGS